MTRALAAAALLLVLQGRAFAQSEVVDPYNSSTTAQYGKPVDIELSQIDLTSSAYERRNVRTHGLLEPLVRGRYWALTDQGARVLLLSFESVGSELDRLLGREIQVTGVVREIKDCRAEPPCNQGHCSICDNPNLPRLPDPDFSIPKVSITVLSAVDMTDTLRKKRESTQRASLETLVKTPGSRDGKLVRVVGKFRGHNLYGDLPAKSQKKRADWVIKDDLFAIWITGKKPKGAGFDLDPSLKRDTGKWIEVVGKPETKDGVTYLVAEQVILSTAPTAMAEAQPPPPPPERPKFPPVVVFAIPLDGEDDVPSDSRFVVQFSKDMDEKTFEGRVILRYKGPVRPGDRAFDAVKLSYDGGRRALTVDPGDVLRPGREVELLLLPGIVDIDGMELKARSDSPPNDPTAVDLLRFVVTAS